MKRTHCCRPPTLLDLWQIARQGTLDAQVGIQTDRRSQAGQQKHQTDLFQRKDAIVQYAGDDADSKTRRQQQRIPEVALQTARQRCVGRRSYAASRTQHEFLGALHETAIEPVGRNDHAQPASRSRTRPLMPLAVPSPAADVLREYPQTAKSMFAGEATKRAVA